MSDMYKKASKLKVRFSSNVGAISVEDLWDLPLTSTKGASLDNVAKAVNRELKDTIEESFVEKASTANSLLELKLEIVKDVISTRIAERDDAKAAVERKAKKETILSILSAKQNSAMQDMSVEDLQKMLESL